MHFARKLLIVIIVGVCIAGLFVRSAAAEAEKNNETDNQSITGQVPSIIPEPCMLALLASGGIGLLLKKRRQSTKTEKTDIEN
ncbi:MAG: PEP-CTERM sorting domain-containing protein [Phycisphaerae bacterium]|nr:PEP-CTERM sorting domain-containing protein [Phycisphaerae bacterium]